jgi:hypothetical protein
MDALNQLLGFLTEIARRRIAYRLEHKRTDARMATVAGPAKRREIEFCSDGEVQLERFGSLSGVVATNVDKPFGPRESRLA